MKKINCVVLGMILFVSLMEISNAQDNTWFGKFNGGFHSNQWLNGLVKN